MTILPALPTSTGERMAQAEEINFGETGIIPVAVQDANTLQLLVIAYTNKEALDKTLETCIVTFWSRTRQELWVKGDTSGNRYWLKEARINCECNSLLYLAIPEAGGMCHITGKNGNAMTSCFYRTIEKTGTGLELKLKE